MVEQLSEYVFVDKAANKVMFEGERSTWIDVENLEQWVDRYMHACENIVRENGPICSHAIESIAFDMATKKSTGQW